MRQYIISTFRTDLDFDNNFYNLLKEKLTLEIDHGINSTMISGKYNNIVKFSLLIPFSLKAKKQVRRIMKEYFQECYLDILNNDAYFVDKEGMVLSHKTWLNVSREEAIENGDFIFDSKNDKFYIVK